MKGRVKNMGSETFEVGVGVFSLILMEILENTLNGSVYQIYRTQWLFVD